MGKAGQGRVGKGAAADFPFQFKAPLGNSLSQTVTYGTLIWFGKAKLVEKQAAIWQTYGTTHASLIQ